MIKKAFIFFSILLTAACAKETGQEIKEGAIIYPELKIRVSEMTFCAETRALTPMSPDLEKYVTSLAVFEFDNEGLHAKGNSTYHFIDFLKGTVDGVEGVGNIKQTEFGIVEFNLKGIAFEERINGTICLVANVTEEQVNDFYTACSHKTGGESFGHITLSQFQDWALPFIYKTPASESGADPSPTPLYDESVSGHLEKMYMFGYYEGPIRMAEAEYWPIDLGRLASRLDITIVNETGREITERLGYNFNNVCDSAYFFPMKKTIPPVKNSQSRTVICTGPNRIETAPGSEIPQTFANESSHTRYFYVAAHSAKNIAAATQLHLYYKSRIGGNPDQVANPDGKPDEGGQDFLVPLCNVHPEDAESVVNGYSLSRNTRYHFTIRLRGRLASSSKLSAGLSANSCYRTSAENSSEQVLGCSPEPTPDFVPGSSPGEYILYL